MYSSIYSRYTLVYRILYIRPAPSVFSIIILLLYKKYFWSHPDFFRNDESAVLAAIEGRGDSKKQTSRTLAKLAQQLDEDL